jgi:hypothetical protein
MKVSKILRVSTPIVGLLVVLGTVGFEVQQVYAVVCTCKCYAVSGLPASYNVNVNQSLCDRDYSFNFNVHFATNDDNCTGTREYWAVSYSSGAGCCNVELNSISPDSSSMVYNGSGRGRTIQYTVTGRLHNDHCNGRAGTTVFASDNTCVSSQYVNILCDGDCQGSCPNNCESCPQ